MKQSEIMMESEADAWFSRNQDKLGLTDPVSDAINDNAIHPTSVLEVGAADGWRLAKLRDKFGCKVLGIDPSMAACNAAAARGVPMYQMTANGLPVDDHSIDLLIYGFCLYLTDPSDWLRIAAEGDRVLKDSGYLIIHDFRNTFPVHARKYEHCEGVLSYHYDFSRLWLGHPLYRTVSQRGLTTDEMVTVLTKRPASAIEVRP